MKRTFAIGLLVMITRSGPALAQAQLPSSSSAPQGMVLPAVAPANVSPSLTAKGEMLVPVGYSAEGLTVDSSGACCVDGRCGDGRCGKHGHGHELFCGAGCSGWGTGPRIWASAEYLLWWIEDGPVPFPLVTTGDDDNPDAGILDQADTVVLFGDKDIDYGTFSGYRLTLGGWLNRDHTFGWEFRGFELERNTKTFSFASDDEGEPPLTYPFFDAELLIENGIIIASSEDLFFDEETGEPLEEPLQQPFSGRVQISSSTKLWGLETNGWCHLYDRACFRADFFTGFRYLDLEESLVIQDHVEDLVLDITNEMNESFKTRNRFYGAQVGGLLGWHGDVCSVLVRGQVAVGGSHERVDIQGTIEQTGADAFSPGVNQGGVYAMSTNIGKHETGRFTVVPELNVSFGLRLGRNCHLTVGYNLLFWDEVLRPANQIDRNLNLSQSPIFGSFFVEDDPDPDPPDLAQPDEPELNGTPVPRALRRASSFWAHGLTFGIDYRY